MNLSTDPLTALDLKHQGTKLQDEGALSGQRVRTTTPTLANSASLPLLYKFLQAPEIRASYQIGLTGPQINSAWLGRASSMFLSGLITSILRIIRTTIFRCDILKRLLLEA